MAGHLKMCEIDFNLDSVNNKILLNNSILKSVGKIKNWLNKIETTNKRFFEKNDWSETFIGRRKIRLLPKEYLMENERENSVAIDMGELPVGKKITYHGLATFEVHYDKVKKYATVYLVA